MAAHVPAVLGETVLATGSQSVAAGPLAALGTLGTVGVLGVMDRILGEDEAPEPTEDAGGGGSGMFDEAAADADGDLAGGDAGGDDEFAFDEGGGDDAFDEFDVGGEGDGGGGNVRELEGRVDELEDEIASISSTVSTVRTENEQISESVDDIEENVRKLLDIYKMVTKGVNPFVDEDGGAGAMPGGGDSLGLFDQDDGDEGPEGLDGDVAEADAEEFFDDDFEEEEAAEPAGGDVEAASTEAAADGGDGDTQSPEPPDPGGGDSAASDDGGGAKSFDELREEYEEGADWAEGEDGEDAEAAESVPEPAPKAEAGADDAAAETSPPPEETASEEPDDDVERADDDRVDELFDEEEGEQASPDPEPGPDPEPDPSTEPSPDPAPRGATEPRPEASPQRRAPAAGTPDGGAPAAEKPYLRELPGGYVADLLVMEWVEFLVTESSTRGAQRAITYYENVGWIGPRAADQLREFVDGHPEATASPGAGPTVAEDDVAERGVADGGGLTMDHHTTSLRYIARITGDVQENVLDAWDGGDNRWLHR